MEEAKTCIDKDYRAERYRSLYGDPAFCVVPPIPCMLEKDPSFLPPADVEGKSGRPKKGPRKRARLPVNGEFHSSSRHSQRMEQLDGTGVGASRDGLSASQGGLSQSQSGLSQSQSGLSQSQSGLSQSAPVDLTS